MKTEKSETCQPITLLVDNIFTLLMKDFSEVDKAITKVLCCAEMLFIYSCTVEEREAD